MHECGINRLLEAEGEEGLEMESTEENAHTAYLEKMEQQAARVFEKHELHTCEESRWILAGKYEDGEWTGVGITEVIVGLNGTVIVHGDYAPVLFYSYDRKAPPQQLVHWVAYSGVNSYLTSKAFQGMMPELEHDPTKTFDPEIAKWEMRECIRDRLVEFEGDWDDDTDLDKEKAFADEIAAWRRAIRGVDCDGKPWYLVRHQLYDDLEEVGLCDVNETIWDIGQVPASCIFYGQAACRKLLELLEQEE